MLSNHQVSTGNMPDITYDYVFVGLGASNSLLLFSLLKNRLHVPYSFAIVEPSQKDLNDKTYCFWASPEDAIVQDLQEIIGHTYRKISFETGKSCSLENQRYYYINSLSLYAHTQAVIEKAGIPLFRGEVQSIHPLLSERNEEYYSLEGLGFPMYAKRVLDSRPFPPPTLRINEVFLNQSFFGLHVSFDREVFAPDTFEMMNFDVAQEGATQFFYILPFSASEGMVELTRFGTERIEKEHAKKLVMENIQQRFGDFNIVAEEIGCIPMTNYAFPKSELAGVLHTGSRGNLIKPSTGYAFKKMYDFAELVQSHISNGKVDAFHAIALKTKKRFQFYDSLLLLILMRWPAEGKRVFTTLFQSQSVATVFSFLDEKSSWRKELSIFTSLPLIPFLKSLFCYTRKSGVLRYVILGISFLVYVFLIAFSEELAFYFGIICTVLGLAAYGIPHGALDAVLSQGSTKNRIVFSAKYLAWIVLYFCLWQLFPLPALVFFILYSAFHFGESELEEANIHSSPIAHVWRSFFLGLSVLMIILFSHVDASLAVISGIKDMAFLPTYLALFSAMQLPVLLLSFSLLLVAYFVSRKFHFLVLSILLFLSMFLPLHFAFAFYFIGQHSCNAWRHIHQKAGLSSRNMFLAALPYTLGAFLVFIGILGISRGENDSWLRYLPDFFVFLACISFPHFFSMHLFYQKK